MRKVLLIITSLLVSVTIIAQNDNSKVKPLNQINRMEKVDDIQAIGDKVSIKDGTQTLMEIENEGDGGSIILPPLSADITSFDNKLYNVGTELYWSGSPLGTQRTAGGWINYSTSVGLYTETDFVGIGTASPSAKLHVIGNDGVLFEGTELAGGTIPKEGAGTRLMWHPSKAAFRAGHIETVGTQWDETNIGQFSVAMGIDTKASGYASTAFGDGASATGFVSTAMGYATASGDLSTAMGLYTKAEAAYSTVIGIFNVGGGDPINSLPTDPLFEIGNGQDVANRSNALTVLKNGNVGIGIATPAIKLHVQETNGTSIFGESENYYGIWGKTSGSSFAGVLGETGSNASWGVYGIDIYGGIAVRGLSTTGYASYFASDETATAGYFRSNFGYGLIVEIGNVGIGTVTPEQLLHLNGANPRILIEASSSNPEINFKNNGDLASDIWSVYKNGTTDDLQFYQNGNQVTIQKNTGNVGIGTTNPKSKLSIVGLSEHADNAAALSAGLVAGDLYRTGDLLKIVH